MNPSRTIRTLIPASAVVIGLAIAGPALAVDRCVNVNGCTAPNSYTSAQLQTALTAAGGAGSGRVLVGAGTYVAPAGGFLLSTAGSVEVVGAGIGSTIIQTGPAQADYSFAITLTNGSSAIRNLTIRSTRANIRGLLLGGTSSGRQIAVEGTAAAVNAWGVFLEGAGAGPLLEDATVTLSGSGGTAVAMNSASTLRRSTLLADRGIVSSNSQATGATISQARINASQVGITSDGGTVLVRDSVVKVTGTSATGVTAVNLNNGAHPIAISLDRVTLSGTDGPFQTGVASQANGAGPDSASVTVRNSIITRVGVPLRRTATPAGTAQLVTAFTDHAAAGVVSQNTGAGIGAITETAPLDVPVAFVSPNTGDWQLVPGSALIDAGDPGDTGTLDLVGALRPRDGNGDGTARVDLGAVESPAPAVVPVTGPPLVPVTPSDTTRPTVTRLRITLEGPIARLRARVNEAGTLRVRIVRAGRKGARVLVVPVRKPGVVKAGFRLVPGARYRVTVTARDRAGNASVARRRALRAAVRAA